MVPEYKELHGLVVGKIGLNKLQNRLYPFQIAEDDRLFHDHSQQGFLKKRNKLLSLRRHPMQQSTRSENYFLVKYFLFLHNNCGIFI